jgi:hypothetical protein
MMNDPMDSFSQFPKPTYFMGSNCQRSQLIAVLPIKRTFGIEGPFY